MNKIDVRQRLHEALDKADVKDEVINILGTAELQKKIEKVQGKTEIGRTGRQNGRDIKKCFNTIIQSLMD